MNGVFLNSDNDTVSVLQCASEKWLKYAFNLILYQYTGNKMLSNYFKLQSNESFR